ncbi:MAG: peptidase M28, partial [Candidatus Angelobacter sp.]
MSLPDSKSTVASDGAGAASAKKPEFDGSMWWNYVKILAADNMEGRETGSPGLRKAQEYVV